jgi:Domain of unknown function (DUF4157)
MSERATTLSKAAPSANSLATNALLQRKCACGNATVTGSECPECAKGKLQRKVSIGATNDPLELEADRVAEHVMHERMRNERGATPVRVQRFYGHSSESAQEVPASVEQVLAGAGRPLDCSLKSRMERRFGYDFSHVRVHAGARAQESARDVNAHAYTVGHDVVFGNGYPETTREGEHLLAHELTHVLQQSGANPLPAAQVDQKRGSPPDASFGGAAAQRKSTSAIDGGGPLNVPTHAANVLQRKWRLDRTTPSAGVEMDYTDDNGDTYGSAIGLKPGSEFGKLSASAVTRQNQGFVKQKVGGKAQLARWMTTHYIFKNDGADQDFLQLKPFAQFGGHAKAEDLKYARAASVVWGRSIERSSANPTPPGKDLFQIKGGVISAATVGDLGEIEADISLGDRGSVKITIPLKKVEEGTFMPYADSFQPLYDIPSSASEVDVQLGARVEADAEIRDDWWGIAPWISRNWNKAFATSTYLLSWESRTAPGAGIKAASETKTETDDAEVRPLGVTYACAICKCQGDTECGGNRYHTIWMGKTECDRNNKARAQKLCNHDRTFLSICDLNQNRKDGKKCSVHHHDFACSERETEQKCMNRRK